MQRLRPTQHGGKSLQSCPDNIVLRLLGSKSRSGGLGVKTQHPGARVLRLEMLAHNARPHAPRRAELGDLL